MFRGNYYDAFRPIVTERLRIRKLTMHDAEDIFAISRNPEVSKTVLWSTHRTIFDSRAMLRSVLRSYRIDEPASFAIELKETGRVIGTIGFITVDYDNSCGEIGYSLKYECWNRGFMTEALSAMLDFGFNKLYLNRIEGMFDVTNPASGRVMEKCGMKKEGILRRKFYNKGKFIDVEMWSILSDEFSEKKQENRERKIPLSRY